MSFIKIENISIVGMATAVPTKTSINTNEKFITTTGVAEKRITDEKICASDLCLEAAEKLIGDLSIDKNDKSVVWQGSDIQNTVKVPNKWDLVQLKIDLKEPLTDDMVIKLYGLNEGKSKVYWDDFSLTFE